MTDKKHVAVIFHEMKFHKTEKFNSDDKMRLFCSIFNCAAKVDNKKQYAIPINFLSDEQRKKIIMEDL